MAESPKRLISMRDHRVVDEKQELDLDPEALDDLIERSPWSAGALYSPALSEQQIRRIAEIWPEILVRSEYLARSVPDDVFEAVALQYPVTAFASAPERFTSPELVEVSQAIAQYQELKRAERENRDRAEANMENVASPEYAESNPGPSRPVVVAKRVYDTEGNLKREWKHDGYDR